MWLAKGSDQKKITHVIQLSIYFLPSICLDLSLICAFHSRIWRVSLLRPLYSLAISLFTFHYSDSKSGRPSPSQFCVRCPTPSAQNGIFSHADRTHVIKMSMHPNKYFEHRTPPIARLKFDVYYLQTCQFLVHFYSGIHKIYNWR